MYLFLGILGGLITTGGSFAILINGTLDSMLEVPRNGYKFGEKTWTEFEDYRKIGKNKTNSKGKSNTIIKLIPFFIPGFNLLYSSVKVFLLKNGVKLAIQTHLKEEGYLVPMTDEEKRAFRNLKGKTRKLSLIGLQNKNDNYEVVAANDKNIFVVDLSSLNISNDDKPLLGYTLDEIKKLNEITGNKYHIGSIENKNIAFIGVPETKQLHAIQFQSEDYKLKHPFVPMTEEDAKDKEFTLYSLTSDEEMSKRVFEMANSLKALRENGSEVKEGQDDIHVFVNDNIEKIDTSEVPSIDLPHEDTSEVTKKTGVAPVIDLPIYSSSQQEGPVYQKSLFPKK